MKFWKVWTAFLILVGLLGVDAYAIPGRGLDLDKLTNDSTLIVLGQMGSLQSRIRSIVIEASEFRNRYGVDWSGPGVNARIDQASLAVDQILKGNVPSNLFTFSFVVPDQFIGWIPPQEGYGLFFFKQTGSGTPELTDPYNSWMPAVRGLNATGTMLTDRVISILQGIISVPDSNPNTKNLALNWLVLTPGDVATHALRSALSDPDPAFRLNVAGVLVKRGDPAGLETMKRAFLPAPQGLPQAVEETVPNALMLLRDPVFVNDFEQLLGSTSKYMRRAAAAALSFTGTPAAMKGLRAAIEDSDFEVRYYGVTGLAALIKETDWKPTLEEYRADESKYLSHWREWARSH